MTRDQARDLAASILRDVPPDDAPPAHDPVEAIRLALWRDAAIRIDIETARALVRAGWRAP
jgi:hypothetical protein